MTNDMVRKLIEILKCGNLTLIDSADEWEFQYTSRLTPETDFMISTKTLTELIETVSGKIFQIYYEEIVKK